MSHEDQLNNPFARLGTGSFSVHDYGLISRKKVLPLKDLALHTALSHISKITSIGDLPLEYATRILQKVGPDQLTALQEESSREDIKWDIFWKRHCILQMPKLPKNLFDQPNFLSQHRANSWHDLYRHNKEAEKMKLASTITKMKSQMAQVHQKKPSVKETQEIAQKKRAKIEASHPGGQLATAKKNQRNLTFTTYLNPNPNDLFFFFNFDLSHLMNNVDHEFSAPTI